ncbi:MAG: class I SAM-dependent methyltransferase [Rhodobacteraceae bacterium]|nr:class I SAM-dependent methyltransferase [Paracoccaceae bacterium]
MSNDPRFLIPFEQGLVEPAESMLVIRPADAMGLSGFENVTIEQGFYPTAKALEGAGFAVSSHAEGRFGMALVNLTRAKAENLANIARASAMTDGVVLVNGAKTEGIESLLKAVKKITSVTVLSKAHGKVFWFDAAPMPAEWLAAGEMAANKDGFITAPGMFSSGKVDGGSALLAPHLEGLKGRVADLGAGWGWLAAQALGPDVLEMVLFEAEHKAVEAAKLNLTDERVRFEWADVLALPKQLPFDVVISNPPFHQSRTAEPGIGVGFIHAAAKLLKPKGRLLMVANRQLPYERTLEGAFRKVEMLRQTNGFKLFEASSPKR